MGRVMPPLIVVRQLEKLKHPMIAAHLFPKVLTDEPVTPVSTKELASLNRGE